MFHSDQRMVELFSKIDTVFLIFPINLMVRLFSLFFYSGHTGQLDRR